jgi:hypothetical protein
VAARAYPAVRRAGVVVSLAESSAQSSSDSARILQPSGPSPAMYMANPSAKMKRLSVTWPMKKAIAAAAINPATKGCTAFARQTP